MNLHNIKPLMPMKSNEKQCDIHGVSHLLIAWEEYKLANMYESDSINVEKMLMERFVAIYCG